MFQQRKTTPPQKSRTGASQKTPSSIVNWPQFRGPESAGIGLSSKLPIKWSATQGVAWRTPLPGRSWSSPIVWGDKLFVTCVIREGESEKPKKGLYFGGERPEPPKDGHVFKLLCFHVHTGKPIWEVTLHTGAPKNSIHLKSSYGAETPCTDGERIYCVFGGLGVFAVSMAGKRVWDRTLDPRKTRYGWGYASSPVVHGGMVVLVNDNDERAELLALDAKTGREKFSVSRDEKSNWSTPFIWQNVQRTEIITCGTNAVRSYSLTGQLLWTMRGMSTIVIPTPIAGGGLLYITSGYVGDSFRPLYAIRPGASGDISLGQGERSNTFIAWMQPTGGPYNPSPLYLDGRIYVLYDRGLVSCYNAQNGNAVYEKERLPDGFAFTVSPWSAAGHIFCLNEDGICYVFRAGDTFAMVGTNRLTDDDMCMATPALAGDKLIIRSSTGLWCIAK